MNVFRSSFPPSVKNHIAPTAPKSSATITIYEITLTAVFIGSKNNTAAIQLDLELRDGIGEIGIRIG